MDTDQNPLYQIALAVLHRALKDCQSKCQDERDDARKFLTNTDGEWKASRELWCQAADMDPDDVRDKALALIGSIPPLPPKAAPKMKIRPHPMENPRNKTILALWAAGSTGPEISAQLNVSIHVVYRAIETARFHGHPLAPMRLARKPGPR